MRFRALDQGFLTSIYSIFDLREGKKLQTQVSQIHLLVAACKFLWLAVFAWLFATPNGHSKVSRIVLRCLFLLLSANVLFQDRT